MKGIYCIQKQQVQLISDKVLLQAAKQQQALAKKCFLMKIVIITYIWLRTGTTLSASVNGLKDTLLSYGIENNQAARLKYLKLMQDGQVLQSLDSYKAVAAKYALPKYVVFILPTIPSLCIQTSHAGTLERSAALNKARKNDRKC